MNIFELQEILVKTTKVLAGKNLPVHLEGFQPRVEYDTTTKQPTRVFLPVIPEGSPPKLVDAIHGYIDHECSHVKFSNADDICDGTKNKLWHYIHNCIEDPRVNKCMGQFYPGAKKNIKRGYDYLFTELVDDKGVSLYSKESVDKIPFSTDEEKAQFQLQFASLWFAGHMGCTISREKYDELKLDRFYEELLKKADAHEVRKLSHISSSDDVKNASDYWTEFFSEEVLDKMRPDTGGEGELTDAEIDKLMEETKSLEDQLKDVIETKIKDLVVESKEHIYWTDRFDKKFDKHDIKREVESRLSGKAIKVAEFEEKTKQVTNYLAKDLRRILEEQRRRYYTGGHKSGKLNSKSLFSVKTGNDRIFKKKNSVRDVNAAVSLLVDMSGSMSGSKIKTAMLSAYAFAMTLQQLKVPYEIYGFVTSNGGHHEMMRDYKKFVAKHPSVEDKIINADSPEYFYAFKEFEENFDITSKVAMTGAANDGCNMIQNEDSKHVMLAMQRLSARPEKVKALFVFSDGSPAYNFSYTQRSYDQLRFLADNAKRKYGVDVYSIGIMSSAVERFYQKSRVINNLSELPAAMFDFLRKVFV